MWIKTLLTKAAQQALPLFTLASIIAMGAFAFQAITAARQELQEIRAEQRADKERDAEMRDTLGRLHATQDSLRAVSAELERARRVISEQNKVTRQKNEKLYNEIGAIDALLPPRPIL